MKTNQKETKAVKNPIRIIKTAPLAISPRKMNLVAGLIRRQELEHSLNILTFLPHKGGRILHKLLQGASKSLVKEKQTPSDFYLSRIEVNQGRTLKRIMYRAKGRSDRIRKRHCLIKLHLSKKDISL